MNELIDSLDWNDILAGDADLAAERFTNVLTNVIQQFIPLKRRQPKDYPPWSNDNLKRLKRIKRAALRKFSKHPSRRFGERYAKANRRYGRLNNKLYNIYLRRTQLSLKRNPKRFWKHVNDQRKESGLPTTMSLGNAVSSSLDGICELFKDQFSGVFSNEDLSVAQVNAAANKVPLGTTIGPPAFIDVDAIERACHKLKNSTNPGPDGIPSIVLKKCSSSLAEPLVKLFNLSLRSGIFPSCWKESYVYPIYKKGKKNDISNYRGIAALSAVSKLFEIVVQSYLSFHCNPYIAQQQHGFMPKRSTSSNLVQYTSSIIRGIQKGQQIDAVYTDLSAAFDKINHKIAIAKFKRLGFCNPFINWLRSHLTGREMRVKIGDTLSAPFMVFSGVPQGSHLGPLIYLVYMNDVHFVLECNKLSFADDIKLYAVIQNTSDTEFLQDQLDKFADWCTRNRMVLNTSKCSVISFSRKHIPLNSEYILNGTILKKTASIKDLGVVLDSKLTFADHIAYVTSKASKTLGFIFRIAKRFDRLDCLKALYCSLVRSTLEYCSVVWAPYYQNSISRIESVQRKFTRFALRHSPRPNPAQALSYAERCGILNLDYLTVRRDGAKALFISDLIQSNINNPELLQHLNIDIRRRTLRNHSFLRIPIARTNYGYNEPLSNMCRAFNSCSDVFDFHLSRDTLKRLFYRHLSNTAPQL